MNCRTFLAIERIGGSRGHVPAPHIGARRHRLACRCGRPQGGPLVTPNGKFFLYSQMRYPAKTADRDRCRRPGQHADALQPRRSEQNSAGEEAPDARMLRQHRRRIADLHHAVRRRAALGAVREGRREAGSQGRAHRMQRRPSAVPAAAHRTAAAGNHAGGEVRRRRRADGAWQPLYPAVHSRRRRQSSSQMGEPHHAGRQ